MDIVISKSPEDTMRIGAAWGREAHPGWIVALQGELGAGKTQLVRGMAQGLESPARVHSPTFALINLYEGGRLTLNHLDLYRLESPDQVESAGLVDYMWNPAGVTVVEWGDRWWGANLPAPQPAFLPPGGLRCVLIQTLEDTVRELRYDDFGH